MMTDLEPRTARAVADRAAARRAEWLRELDALLGGELDDGAIDRCVALLTWLGLAASGENIARLRADRAAALAIDDARAALPSAVERMTAARNEYRAVARRLGSELKALRQRIERLDESPEGAAQRKAASAVAELHAVIRTSEPAAIRWKCLMGSA